MIALEGFEEVEVGKEFSQITVPLMRVELAMNIRYFIDQGEIGYCGLLISGVKGKGLMGKLAAAAARSYVGRTIFIFLSEVSEGKKLVTVPALFEKEPTFDGSVDLSDLIIKTYYPDEFRKNAIEIYNEHLDALMGKKINNNKEELKVILLDLPRKGIEILKSYK